MGVCKYYTILDSKQYEEGGTKSFTLVKNRLQVFGT